MERFTGKVVIITGAGSGLGRATAIEIAKEGAKLVLVDLNQGGLEETKKVVLESAPNAELVLLTCDVSNEADVKKYVDETVAKFGRIDGLFNNAGIEGKQAIVEEYESKVFAKVIDVNLKGVWYGLKYVIPVMKKQKEGYIVNTASIGGIRGVYNQTAYVASKHAVVGLTKNAAIESAPFGISVNAICPGIILTDMVRGAAAQIDPSNPEAVLVEFGKSIPAQRMGEPKEIGRLVAFLLSGEAPFINGSMISIDGAAAARMG